MIRGYSFPQKLSSVEFPVTFSQFLLNLDCESICDPPGGDTLLAQGIYLTTVYMYIYEGGGGGGLHLYPSSSV